MQVAPSHVTGSGERIFWDEEEKAAVAARLLELYLSRPFEPFTELITEAQLSIAPGRRRKVNALAAIPWVKDALKKGIRKLREGPPPPPPPPAPPPPPPPPKPEETLGEVSTPLLFLELMRRSIGVTETLMHDVAEMKNSIDNMQYTIRQVGTERAKQENNKIPTTKTIKGPKFVVVGLLPDQKQLVVDALGDRTELVFLGSDDCSSDRIPSTATMAFVMIKFVKHAVEQRLRDKLGRKKVRLHSAGISELIKAMEGYLPKLSR